MAQGRMPLHQARNVTRIEAKTTEAVDLNIDDTGQTRSIWWMQNPGFSHLTFFSMRPVHFLVGAFCSTFIFRRVVLYTKDDDVEMISLLKQ
jgi:hypothetical protein